MSAEKLQSALGWVEEAVKRDKVRGVVLLVARRSQIVLHEALGWQNKEKGLPMKLDSLIRTASNTKPILAAAVQMLGEDGKFSLDDAIGQHLPAFHNEKYRGVTIRHLLNHTSGLRIRGLFLDPLMKKSREHPDAPNLQLEVSRFAKVGPQEKPGGAHSYSSAGYNILGSLVEVSSRQPLETFLTERIFRPLTMRDASSGPIAEKVDRMSVVYETQDEGWRVRFGQADPSRVPFARGSGGIVCTALDYAKFCQMLLNGGTYGGKRLLTAKSVQEATSQQVRTSDSFYTTEEYNARRAYRGFTWNVSEQGPYFCGGSDGTFAWVDPQRQLIGVIFTQSSWQAIGGREGLNIQFMKRVNSACER